MKKKIMFGATTLLLTAFLFYGNVQAVKAEDTNDTGFITDNSLAGMSLIMTEYYDERLSETGISIRNVTTPIYVNGQRLSPVNDISLFDSLGISNAQDYVNVREKANTDSEIVGKLHNGAVATILESGKEWTKISSGSVTGYVKTEYLSMGDDAQTIADKTLDKIATVTCITLNIRSGPSVDNSILAQIGLGDELEVVEEQEDWVKVKYGNYDEAYVSKDYVELNYEFTYAVSKEEEEQIALKNSYNINHMIWPLPSDHNIYSYYGYRTPPTSGASSFHRGLDIGGSYGSNIVAALSGTVITASYNRSSGYYVEISHGNGVVTRYQHSSKLLVSPGQKVMQGDVIALVGSTGISTGPHLHFSLVINGSNVDPYPYLRAVH